ncbi:MAG: hypothetical protein IKH15_08730, partial [Bacteroidales bacterium]|nr:hypothetical protein [Bacteroidales bacterium]
MSELYYRLALQFLPNLGPTTTKKLLQHYGSATQIFTARDIRMLLGNRAPVPKLTDAIRRQVE